MNIRRFQNEDANELADVIAYTLRTTNIKDYSTEYIENDISFLRAENLIERSKWMNVYVVCDDKKIIGCGAIGPYWGKEDESSVFTVFVLPEYQGNGIGRKIFEALEQDEYFLRAKRIEIPQKLRWIFIKKWDMTLKMVLQKLMMNSYITWKNSDKFQFMRIIQQQKYSRKQFEKLLSGVKF